MKKFFILFVAAIFITNLFSCNNDSTKNYKADSPVLRQVNCNDLNLSENIEVILHEAGSNRSELERLLSHYKDDSLKYRAACFLIENMPGHYSYIGEKAEVFHREIDLLLDTTPINNVYHDTRKICAAVDSITKCYPQSGFQAKPDIEIITADFLINNIEQAFDQWQNKPWARHLDFDEFCEFLLPYTIDNYHVLEDWRPKIAARIDTDVIHKLGDFQYSSEMKHSAYWACEVVNYYLYEKLDRDNTPDKPSSVRQLSTLVRIPYGMCEHFCDIALLTMRSIGIPIIIDYTPQWPFRSWGHSWGIVPMSNGKNFSFSGCDKDFGTLHKAEQKMAKVFRKTYARNRDIEELNRQEKYVPALFRNIFQKDVSNEYMKTCDISVPIKNISKNKYAYLAVFDNQSWVPVCYGKKEGDKFVFKNIGRNIVYLPVYQMEHGLVSFSDPFILDINGNIRFLHADTKLLQTTTLERKFFLSQRMHMYVGRLIGGRIEAANKADFSDAVLLHTIDKWSIFPDSIKVNSDKQYQYWRYVSPKDGLCNIAELQFYTNNEKQIKGTVLGTDEAYYPEDPSSNKYAAFDDDPLTYFDASRKVERPWVGMDFGKPITINKIRYIPRNDGNNIHIGDTYELFYWDNKWISLGKQIGKGKSLHYDNVPKNALLLLRDLTRGKEERIFTYEDDEQVWW